MLDIVTDKNPKLKKIIIVGSGATAWTVAATLANGLIGLSVDLIVLNCVGLENELLPCISTTPATGSFIKLLGVNEKDFLIKTQATCCLAARYEGLNDSDNYYMLFSEHGFMMNGIDFSSYALCARTKGDETPYDAYALSSVAARMGRFMHPLENSNSIFSTLSYGFQINTGPLSDYWGEYAKRLGVEEITCEVKSLLVEESAGDISAIKFKRLSGDKSGIYEKISGDLYIDCTGAQGMLIGEALKVNYDSLQDFLPVDRCCYAIAPSQFELPPNVTISPQIAGWSKEISTRSTKQLTYAYNSQFIDDKSIADFFEKKGFCDDEVKQLPISPGRRASFWHKNCIAIGKSAGYLQDFTIDQLHLIQSASLRLLTLFPATTEYELHSKEYNRLTIAEYQHIIDFHQLHYKVVNSIDSSFWQFINKAPLTSGLKHKISTFSRRGHIPYYEGETLSPGTWISFLLGANQWPASYDPIIDTFDARWATEQLVKMRTMMASAAQKMPVHSEYLDKF